MSEILLRVKALSVGIKSIKNIDMAVEEVSLNIRNGEILGIVGESGCGKSLTALALAGLLPKDAIITQGSIIFDGTELKGISKDKMRKIQGKDISIIFQEPMTSLNPLLTIGKQVGEGLRIHYKFTEREIKERVLDVLNKVGLPMAKEVYNSYPHQLSGGMRQRVMIAIAIICKPKLIIADEPTTALDVTIQAQILKLLRDINKEYNTSILFISHDLGVISRLCHRVIVMYAGSLVEEGTVKNIFLNPTHQYTKGLIASIPTMDKRGKRLVNISGKVPSIQEKRFGCRFSSRCEKAEEKCFYELPPSVNLGPNHRVCCNLAIKESGEDYVI
ncbi:ABC transporter ATP-binding protein [Clostridium sp. 19966]|nr:ABC transporter ATP-binding protein [Clostridium sp. 19966]